MFIVLFTIAIFHIIHDIKVRRQKHRDWDFLSVRKRKEEEEKSPLKITMEMIYVVWVSSWVSGRTAGVHACACCHTLPDHRWRRSTYDTHGSGRSSVQKAPPAVSPGALCAGPADCVRDAERFNGKGCE